MPRKKPLPKQVAPSPSWTLEDGVSQSLLNRFMGCRERFRLYSVEGAREKGDIVSRDFGTYFHDLLECHAKYPNISFAAIVAKVNKKKRKTELSYTDKQIAVGVFEHYINHFSDCQYKYFKQEEVFKVPYDVPGKRKILLRGRFDGIIKRPDGTLWIQENKTKQRISPEVLEATIPYNLQTMMYAIAAQIKYKKKVTGIVYNVIRRPGHRQKKGESIEDFVTRIKSEIEKDPYYYFYRWEYPLSEIALETWKKKTFNPLLTSLIQWWESVKNDPFSPWEDEKGLPNPHHWQRPFGVYDSLTAGKGDYFDLMVRGYDKDVTKGNKPFEELIDDV